VTEENPGSARDQLHRYDESAASRMTGRPAPCQPAPMTTPHMTGTSRRPIHRPLLIACLLAAPAVLTVSELARLRVESAHVESEDAVVDARSQLDAVAAQLPLWHLAAVLDLLFIIAWLGALLAAVLVVARTRPRAGLATGAVAVLSGLGLAMHNAFYYQALADLAGTPDHDQTARVLAASGSDWLSAVALLVFFAGALLTPIVLGVSLWRAHALPWWAAAGLVLWLAGVFVGSEATPAALVNLALLLPFAAVARHLSEPSATHRQERRVSTP
jgi:hypothetical protein